MNPNLIHNTAPYPTTADVRPVPRYAELAWLNSLPLYNLSQCSDEMLDLLREIQTSGDYYFQGKPFPILNPGDLGIGAGLNISGSISIPPYSYLTMLTAFSNTNGGFKIRIYDKGAKVDLFDKLWAWDRIIASNQATLNDPAIGTIPPHLLMGPLVVLPPGLLQIEIANMDLVNTNLVQVMFYFAVPKTSHSTGTAVVNDPGVAY